jgi:hypothetical protein
MLCSEGVTVGVTCAVFVCLCHIMQTDGRMNTFDVLYTYICMFCQILLVNGICSRDAEMKTFADNMLFYCLLICPIVQCPRIQQLCTATLVFVCVLYLSNDFVCILTKRPWSFHMKVCVPVWTLLMCTRVLFKKDSNGGELFE